MNYVQELYVLYTLTFILYEPYKDKSALLPLLLHSKWGGMGGLSYLLDLTFPLFLKQLPHYNTVGDYTSANVSLLQSHIGNRNIGKKTGVLPGQC